MKIGIMLTEVAAREEGGDPVAHLTWMSTVSLDRARAIAGLLLYQTTDATLAIDGAQRAPSHDEPACESGHGQSPVLDHAFEPCDEDGVVIGCAHIDAAGNQCAVPRAAHPSAALVEVRRKIKEAFSKSRKSPTPSKPALKVYAKPADPRALAEKVLRGAKGWDGDLVLDDGEEGKGLYIPMDDGALLDRLIAFEDVRTDPAFEFCEQIAGRWNAAPVLARALLASAAPEAKSQDWRPVTEAEPAIEQDVLVTCDDWVGLGYRRLAGAPSENKWRVADSMSGDWNYVSADDITAWQPLPLPASAPPAAQAEPARQPPPAPAAPAQPALSAEVRALLSEVTERPPWTAKGATLVCDWCGAKQAVREDHTPFTNGHLAKGCWWLRARALLAAAPAAPPAAESRDYLTHLAGLAGVKPDLSQEEIEGTIAELRSERDSALTVVSQQIIELNQARAEVHRAHSAAADYVDVVRDEVEWLKLAYERLQRRHDALRRMTARPQTGKPSGFGPDPGLGSENLPVDFAERARWEVGDLVALAPGVDLKPPQGAGPGPWRVEKVVRPVNGGMLYSLEGWADSGALLHEDGLQDADLRSGGEVLPVLPAEDRPLPGEGKPCMDCAPDYGWCADGPCRKLPFDPGVAQPDPPLYRGHNDCPACMGRPDLQPCEECRPCAGCAKLRAELDKAEDKCDAAKENGELERLRVECKRLNTRVDSLQDHLADSAGELLAAREECEKLRATAGAASEQRLLDENTALREVIAYVAKRLGEAPSLAHRVDAYASFVESIAESTVILPSVFEDVVVRQARSLVAEAKR